MGVSFAFLPERLIQKASFDFLAKQFESNSIHTVVGCLWIVTAADGVAVALVIAAVAIRCRRLQTRRPLV